MTAQQPQREYIITEEDILILEDSFGVNLIVPRSRPHTPSPLCESVHIPTQNEFIAEFVGQEQKKRDEHDAATTRTATLAENKRVLDKMAYWLKSNRCPPTKKKGDGCDGGCGMCMIESLRSTAAQEDTR
jgi:hypothetical protein